MSACVKKAQKVAKLWTRVQKQELKQGAKHKKKTLIFWQKITDKCLDFQEMFWVCTSMGVRKDKQFRYSCGKNENYLIFPNSDISYNIFLSLRPEALHAKCVETFLSRTNVHFIEIYAVSLQEAFFGCATWKGFHHSNKFRLEPWSWPYFTLPFIKFTRNPKRESKFLARVSFRHGHFPDKLHYKKNIHLVAV